MRTAPASLDPALRRLGLGAALLAACGSSEGPRVVFDPRPDAPLWAAPWPADHRDHARALATWTPATANELLSASAALIADRGLPATSASFFVVDRPVGPGEAPLALAVDVSEGEGRGRRWPVRVAYTEAPAPDAPGRVIAVLPEQGLPWTPGRTVAVVLPRAAWLDAEGRALQPDPTTAALLDGEVPEGLPAAAGAAALAALEVLAAEGVDRDAIATLSLRTAEDPTADLDRVLAAARADFRPVPSVSPRLVETHPGFCVFEGRLRLPSYQAGRPPFLRSGGAFGFDAGGRPLRRAEEEARLFVTLPRRPPPAEGFPTVVFVRTGGGGDRPLIDRGRRGVEGGPALEPGSGPARELAREGWAGLMIDGPLGGLRNLSGGDEQFLIFNIGSPPALRDNVRQSALELALLPELAAGLVLGSTLCPELGGAEARLDVDRLALMGHSMGATIGPLAFRLEPRFRALVLSGFGGSWIENVVHKERPVRVRPLMELVLGYAEAGLELHPFAPSLSLLQWAGEPADPPVHAAAARGRHVLMLQGIKDSYILPPIANAGSAALGLDLAGPALESSAAEALGRVGRGAVALPVSGNQTGPDGPTTRVVVQHRQGPVEDGHEVMFQTEAPKRQYRCFLRALAEGRVPVVVDGADDACP